MAKFLKIDDTPPFKDFKSFFAPQIFFWDSIIFPQKKSGDLTLSNIPPKTPQAQAYILILFQTMAVSDSNSSF